MSKKDRRQIGRVPAPLGVSGGFRAGKRHRGVSLLRKSPRASTVVTTFVAKDEHGNTVANIKTLTYKRDSK